MHVNCFNLYHQERKNFQEYLVQIASESEVYRKHLERLQMVGTVYDINQADLTE